MKSRHHSRLRVPFRTVLLLLSLGFCHEVFPQCGSQWTLIARYPVGPPSPVTSIVPVPEESGSLICGTAWLWDDPASGGIYRFQDQPLAWTYIALAGERVEKLKRFLNKPNSIFAVTNRGLYVADSTAAEWNLVREGGAEQFRDFAIAPEDSTLWILVKNQAGSGTILLSRNSGETWHHFYEGYPRANLTFSNRDPSAFYFAEGYSLKRGSVTDSTFVNILTIPGEVILETVAHAREPWIYCVTPRHLILYDEMTEDTLCAEFPEFVDGTYGLLYQDGVGLLVSSSFALYSVSDNLRQWTTANDSLPTGSYAWWMCSDDSLWLAAFSGYAVYCRSSGNAIDHPASQVATGKTTIFPNPIAPNGTLTLEISGQGIRSVVLYNLLGQEVYRHSMSNDFAGEHQVHIALPAEIPTGVYFAAISTAKRSLVQKVIVNR